jgi:1,4-dihydroxy-6-naphthoate synthase
VPAGHFKGVDAERRDVNRPRLHSAFGFPVGGADRDRCGSNGHLQLWRVAPVGCRYERCGARPSLPDAPRSTHDPSGAATGPFATSSAGDRDCHGHADRAEDDRRCDHTRNHTGTGREQEFTNALLGRMTAIRLAFSPDSDDIFMFWPLLAGKVDPEGLVFEAERADTETLNARAAANDLDIIAVSVARWPSISDGYLLLAHGLSVGRGYGPIVVSKSARHLASLRGARIGVPGLRTTAYMVLRLLLPEFHPVVIPITPFAGAFEALRAGEVDAALIIHEGRLTYEREAVERVCDLGEAWAQLTGGLPLPLGGNAVRRALGPELVTKVSRLCRASIAWALDNREETMRALLERELRSELALNRPLLDRYLAMYANADTLDAQVDVRQAIDELYGRAHAAGLLGRAVRAEFATSPTAAF